MTRLAFHRSARIQLPVFPDEKLTPEHAANPEWVLKNLAGNVRLSAACVMESEGSQTVSFTVSALIHLKERLPVPTRDLWVPEATSCPPSGRSVPHPST